MSRKAQNVQEGEAKLKGVRFIAALVIVEYGNGQYFPPVLFIQAAEVVEHSFVKVFLHVSLGFYMDQD